MPAQSEPAWASPSRVASSSHMAAAPGPTALVVTEPYSRWRFPSSTKPPALLNPTPPNRPPNPLSNPTLPLLNPTPLDIPLLHPTLGNLTPPHPLRLHQAWLNLIPLDLPNPGPTQFLRLRRRGPEDRNVCRSRHLQSAPRSVKSGMFPPVRFFRLCGLRSSKARDRRNRLHRGQFAI